jgi:hypothetical protein
MPVFTAVAAFVSAAVGGGLFGAIAGFAARTLLTIGISKLISNRTGTNAAGTQDVGSRVHVPPASNNKLPVVYGKAYMGSVVTDMKISEDGKKMWYVCAISEVTNTMPGQTPDTFTFGDIYWSGKKVIFDGTDTSKVIRLETNSDPVQIDDNVNGKIHMYRFPNGSGSGIDTGGSNAITLMSDSSIPADLRWNSALYTTGGKSASMTHTAFVIVTVDYDSNAGTTGLVPINVEITNSRYKPGDVIYDYLYNSVYGCAIPLASIDTASLADLNAYSIEQINYLNNGSPATQDRYQINGPIQTGDNCLTNLQQLVDACDSWLQYSELVGKWKVVINKPYDGDITDLYQVTDSNLMSGINVNPIDLNNAFNVLEVQFPNTALLDKTDYAPLNLIDYAPEVMSYNEPVNKLTVQYAQVNNYVQAVYLGERRLLQSREDLVIDFALDYSGIQIEAGDVITVKFAPYGWEAFNSGYGKLFRVSQVQEAKIDDGSLGVKITAFEYNDTIYANNPFEDFVPESNTGLTDPNIFDRPTTPIVTLAPVANGAINYYSVSSNVPAVGTTLYMDFNIGNSSNIATHKSYSSVQVGDGTPYTANSTITINVADSSPGTYYWSTTARNDVAGRQSNSSTAFTWAGPSVSTYNANTNVGGIQFSQMSPGASGAVVVTNYDVPNYGGALRVPVAATGTSARNIPLIYPGSNPGASYIFPYAQGTATTANGYSTNSTAAWTPATSALLYISTGVNSYQNWYRLITVNLSSVTWKDTELIVSQGTFNVSSDTANTLYQIVPYARFSNDTGNYVLQTQYLQTYVTSNADPYTSVASFTINLQAAGEVIETGSFIRNITASSNLTIYAGTYAVQQRYIGPGSVL